MPTSPTAPHAVDERDGRGEGSGKSKSKHGPRARASTTKRAAARGAGSLVDALEALHRGDFTVRLKPGADVDAEVVESFNRLAQRNENLRSELRRLAAAVGQQGDLSARVQLS